jgi:hypothetical protein
MSEAQNKQEAKAAPKPYMVWDKNQRGEKPRIHEVIVKAYPDGREPDTMSYQLYSEEAKGCPMPMDHAMKFLTDPAFIVRHPNGNRIMPVEKLDLHRPLHTLAEDELVVKYDELSREALLRRVKVLPGSEDIRENAKHEELVAFMVRWRQSLKGKTEGERALAEKMGAAGFDGMNDEQLENMFPSRKAA